MASINVKRFIIHELIKDKSPDKASELLDLSEDIVSNLAVNLISIYTKKTTVIWGRFNEGEQFPKKLLKHIQKDDDTEFVNLTRSSMDDLAVNMSGTSGTGGYICFVEYESKNRTRMLVSMVKNTEGVRLNNLKPETDIHVDTSKLHQAIDISLTGYNDSFGKADLVENYLGFVSKKGEPIGYFQNSFSCNPSVTPVMAVNKSLAAVCEYLSEHTSDDSILKSAHRKVLDYYKENSGKTVSLRKINDIVNAHLPEDKEEARDGFLEFSKKDEWQLPDHLMP